MLEKLGFQSLMEQTLTSRRIPRAMDLYRFPLGIVLGLYIGCPRLHQLLSSGARLGPQSSAIRDFNRPDHYQIPNQTP